MVNKLTVLQVGALAFLAACHSSTPPKTLPDGFKVWVMNSDERYVSDANDVLLVGPRLERIGVTSHYVVTVGTAAGPEYIGNLRTSGYSLIDRSTHLVQSEMSEAEAARRLSLVGDSMPALAGVNEYQRVPP
jgi:hypothetical protein